MDFREAIQRYAEQSPHVFDAYGRVTADNRAPLIEVTRPFFEQAYEEFDLE